MLQRIVKNNKLNCHKCKKWKVFSSFNKGKTLSGKRSQCRNCERNYKMMLRYGLNVEQVKDFWKRKKCEICDEKFINYGSGQGRHKCIDHSHITGLARGILCNVCNSAIGYLEDNPKLIQNAIKYLTEGGTFTKQFLQRELEKTK